MKPKPRKKLSAQVCMIAFIHHAVPARVQKGTVRCTSVALLSLPRPCPTFLEEGGRRGGKERKKEKEEEEKKEGREGGREYPLCTIVFIIVSG